MAYGIAANAGAMDGKMENGILRGTQQEIACGCWCTSTGKITPMMVKLKDEEGQMQVIRDITVHPREKKRYAGIPSIEYDCTLAVNGRCIRAWLIFYQTQGRWVLNFRG